MFNLARQAFTNPFLSAEGASFQPGAVGSVGRCPGCGSVVSIGSTPQPQVAGINPLGFGQQTGGVVPTPYPGSQGAAFGQINPLASQSSAGVTPGANPFAAQFGANWPMTGHHSQQGVGSRAGAYGIDPRAGLGMSGQQTGYGDPNAVPGLINPNIGDPISSLLSQQVNPLAQQQLPIRPLFGGQQAVGSQSFIPGLASPTSPWTDPYKAFIEAAQLVCQLANNPLYQPQRAYGGQDVTGPGVPSGAGQQINPFFANVPFYG